MTKQQNTVVLGEILELMPNTMYKILLEDQREILAVPSGKLRRSFVKIMPGNKVRVEMTPYDDSRGRVISKIGGRKGQ